MNINGGIQDVRLLVYGFKNGRNRDVEHVAEIIVESVKIKKWSLDNACLMIIPASSPMKTAKRYDRFCQIVSTALNIVNGYDYLKGESRKETKGDSKKNIMPYLSFDAKGYKGRNVLLFDDVITTGTSFRQIATELLRTGANSVIGIFLAKTIES